MNEKVDREDELRMVPGLFGVCFVRSEKAAKRALIFNAIAGLIIVGELAAGVGCLLYLAYQILKVQS